MYTNKPITNKQLNINMIIKRWKNAKGNPGKYVTYAAYQDRCLTTDALRLYGLLYQAPAKETQYDEEVIHLRFRLSEEAYKKAKEELIKSEYLYIQDGVFYLGVYKVTGKQVAFGFYDVQMPNN